jgi:hypothetical protein
MCGIVFYSEAWFDGDGASAHGGRAALRVSADPDPERGSIIIGLVLYRHWICSCVEYSAMPFGGLL